MPLFQKSFGSIQKFKPKWNCLRALLISLTFLGSCTSLFLFFRYYRSLIFSLFTLTYNAYTHITGTPFLVAFSSTLVSLVKAVSFLYFLSCVRHTSTVQTQWHPKPLVRTECLLSASLVLERMRCASRSWWQVSAIRWSLECWYCVTWWKIRTVYGVCIKQWI